MFNLIFATVNIMLMQKFRPVPICSAKILSTVDEQINQP